MGRDVEKPLWLKLAGCGFAAVMAASLVIGGHGLYREYQLGDAALDDQSRRNIGEVLDDMDAQRRTGLLHDEPPARALAATKLIEISCNAPFDRPPADMSVVDFYSSHSERLSSLNACGRICPGSSNGPLRTFSTIQPGRSAKA